MKRRNFIQAAWTTVLAAGMPGHGLTWAVPGKREDKVPSSPTSISLPNVGAQIAGVSFEEHRADLYDRMFNRFLSFWEKGGCDRELGGIMCELDDNGSVVDDQKYIWYQGRSLWVYSYLYNNFGRKPEWLDFARKTRDFMVRYMLKADGRWREFVDRAGKPIAREGQSDAKDIYGAMFAAAGLFEFYKAAGDEKDLALGKASIWKSMKDYDSRDYEGVVVPSINKKGLRTQGHSFMVVWPLTGLLSSHDDRALEKLQAEHVSHIMNDFWNPEYGIVNENLLHDYHGRIPGHEGIMNCGHSLETQWMVLYEALRIKDRSLFDKAVKRIRRLIEMDWDYLHDGWGTGDYYAVGTKEHCPGPEFDVKTMWAHAEILVACLAVLEYTGAEWARDFYGRAYAYILETMANTEHGVWRQAVDRFGRDVKRDRVSAYRKCNFHQPRTLMLCIQSLDRMIKNQGRITPFPD